MSNRLTARPRRIRGAGQPRRSRLGGTAAAQLDPQWTLTSRIH